MKPAPPAARSRAAPAALRAVRPETSPANARPRRRTDREQRGHAAASHAEGRRSGRRYPYCAKEPIR